MKKAAGVSLLALLLLTLGALRFWRLDAPPGMVFDEIYYAKAARQYLAGHKITEEITHPPLSKLLIALGMRIAGDRAQGWRIMSAVAGTFLVALVFLLGWDLSRSIAVAAIGGFLVAVDGLAFVESRIAKPDVFLVTFVLAALLALRRYLDRPSAAWLYVSGCFVGLALSTKWTAVLPLATIPVYLILQGLRTRRWLAHPRHRIHFAAAYTVLPAAIYLATWIPYFMQGHSITDLAKFHWWMLEFHARLTQGHPYQSPWWSWPLLIRPIWYEFGKVREGVVAGILAIGNVAVWWAAIPALLYLGWSLRPTIGERQPAGMEVVEARWRDAATFALTGFALSYFPYAFISRALFLYHMLPALPFMGIAIALVVSRVGKRTGWGVPLLYMSAAVAWFVAYLPVLAGLPISSGRFYKLMWFGTWI